MDRRQIVVAITGASGAAYAKRLIEQLLINDCDVHLVVSPFGRQVFADELGIRKIRHESFVGGAEPAEAKGALLTMYNYRDVGARLASGSFLTQGMVICPCSSNTLASVAAGLADNLIDRAALVTLKEARRLILVPRETPLSPIDIENYGRLSRVGVIICPASPGFYLLPKKVGDLVDFVVGKVLDLLGVSHELNVRWTGSPPNDATQNGE